MISAILGILTGIYISMIYIELKYKKLQLMEMSENKLVLYDIIVKKKQKEEIEKIINEGIEIEKN